MDPPVMRELSPWEKRIWLVIAAYLLIVLWVFWVYGFSRLPFPV